MCFKGFKEIFSKPGRWASWELEVEYSSQNLESFPQNRDSKVWWEGHSNTADNWKTNSKQAAQPELLHPLS